jgi:hypothetical protein
MESKDLMVFLGSEGRSIDGRVAFFCLQSCFGDLRRSGWAEFIMDGSDRANRLLENSPLFTKRLGTLDLVRVGKKRESSSPSVEY